MEKKKGIVIIFISIVFIVLALYYGWVNKNKSNMKEEVFCTFPIAGTYTDYGILKNDNGLINMTDVKSGITVPLCDKPNCSHKPESAENPKPTCNAAVVDTKALAFYNNKLYFCTRVEGEPLTSIFLFQSDLNGGNRRRVAEIKVPVTAWITTFLYKDNKLFIAFVNSQEANTLENLEKPVTGIAYVDLSIYKSGLIYKENVYNNITAFDYSSKDNELIYSYNYSNVKQAEFYDKDMNFLVDKAHKFNASIISEVYSYNLDTKKEKLIRKAQAETVHIISEHKAYYSKLAIGNEPEGVNYTSSYVYDFKSNTEINGEASKVESLIENNNGLYLLYDKEKGIGSLDLLTGNLKQIKTPKNTIIYGLSNKYVFVSLPEGENKVAPYAIERNQFLKGDLSHKKKVGGSMDVIH